MLIRKCCARGSRAALRVLQRNRHGVDGLGISTYAKELFKPKCAAERRRCGVLKPGVELCCYRPGQIYLFDDAIHPDIKTEIDFRDPSFGRIADNSQGHRAGEPGCAESCHLWGGRVNGG